MSEYLAPGVYVEEVDTGSKPIEGVSTSTAGMVGVTERGPVGVPVLVTSFGEYTRLFGGYLDPDVFEDHVFLPHAVEGFFTNSGKRLYVVRVLDDVAASRASFNLHHEVSGGAVAHETVLLRSAGAGDTGLVALEIGTLTGSETVRIGDGSASEYRVLDAGPFTDDPGHVPVAMPLTRSHAETLEVRHVNEVIVAGFTLDAPAARGDSQVVVAGAAGDLSALETDLAGGLDVLLRIGDPDRGDYRLITAVAINAGTATVTLDAALTLDHDNGDTVERLEVDVLVAGVNVDDDVLHSAGAPGAGVVFVDDRNTNFDDTAALILFRDAGGAVMEARRIGALGALTVDAAFAGPVLQASIIEAVTVGDGDTETRALTNDVQPGSVAVTIDVRRDLSEGDVVRLGGEYATVDQIPNAATNGGADPGTIIFTTPLASAHSTGDALVLQNDPALTGAHPATGVVFAAAEGDTTVLVSDGTGYAAGDVVRIITPTGRVSFAVIDGVDVPGVTMLEVTDPVANAHDAGSAVAEREGLFRVEALDAGGWGNRLRVSVSRESPGIVARTTLQQVTDPTHIRLASAAGVEAGTVLEFIDPATGEIIGDAAKVLHLDRSNFTITLADPLTAAQQALGIVVRSVEFSMTVLLLRQPDPASPSRNATVLDSETFRFLSMDPRHSQYVGTVVGLTEAAGGTLRPWDRRPEGSSAYVRIEDLAATAADAEEVRLGPETLFDVLPNGRTRPARHPLSGGDDAVGTLTDTHYVGTDAAEPEDRTGLHSLRNIDVVSIVAAPGRTSTTMQDALIAHCENDRYRFAVLDGPPPPGDTLTDVQTQRQQFDTKYAALYHPWLHIVNPFPVTLAEPLTYPIPPSGHVIGVYARTDIERGVHKAPANEVVRGIVGLRRSLKKEEQDILNPYPVNINVIRDFRDTNRGIRIWGARVITSDPDYKYVPVRRLLIFLEESIDEGLQWVVFEPNHEPLWARVRRTISDFLRVVWRNGALEGTTEEQAFFVRCDRTTMTQTDIDNGRLICLVGVAPVKPAEYVIIRIGLKTAESES